MQFIVQGYPAYAYSGGVEPDLKLPAIVFAHGAAFDHSVWQWQSRYFAHHGYCVLAVDLPGHGRSPGMLRTRIEDWASWLVGILDAVGLAQAAFVGHSMGSLIALEAALRAPERVSRLALVGSAVPMAVGDGFRAAAREEPAVAYDMEATWGHARLTQLATSAVPGSTLLGASRSLNGRARAGALSAALEACNAYRPDPALLHALAIPTLVVAGKRDQMTPFKAGRSLAAQIPGARFVALDAGHSMMSEAPRELLRALRDFLGG